MIDSSALRSRLDDIRRRMASAASRAGRDPASVRLIAVSKTFSAEHIRAIAAAGQVDFGESKVQEAQAKMAALQDLHLRWHLVGHLQSNKARKAATLFETIHSVDSASLLDPLDRAAAAAGRRLDLLIQVDLAGEATKFGVQPDGVRAVLDAVERTSVLRVAGLMLLPPAVVSPEEARPYFATLRRLRDELAAEGGRTQAPLTELSMGMSHDFEVAVEEGATMVRVGSALFGDRPPA